MVSKTDKFNKGLSGARKRLTSFVSGVTKSIAKIGAFGGAITAVVAGGGLAALTAQAFGSIDALAKTADKLGIATDKLTELQFAAEQTGASAETMNLGLQRMVRRVSEAAKGGGSAAKTLKEIGINAQALNAMSPDQQFKTLADAISKTQNPADQLEHNQQNINRHTDIGHPQTG